MRANFRCKPWTLALWVFLLNVPVFGQSMGLWSGTAQCTVTEQDQSYQRREVQTWALTGAAPTQQGAMQIYPATWTDTGSGQLQRVQGAQTNNTVWQTNAQGAASIVFFIRASDNRLIIATRHARQSVYGGISATRQMTVNGAAQSPTPFHQTLFEWAFPRIETDPSTNVVDGSTQSPSEGLPADLLHNFGGSVPLAMCQWHFAKGGMGSANSTPSGMGAPQNSSQQGSNFATAGISNAQNCQSPATVQQSFETMKAQLKAQYDQLIRGTTDAAELAALTNQEQKMLASLTNQEQHDMTLASQGCLPPSSATNSAGSSSTNTSGNGSSNTASNGTTTPAPPQNPGTTATGGQATQTPANSGNSVSAVSLTTTSSGNGLGSITVQPAGVACGLNCMQYSPGTSVTVIATPNNGSQFTNYNGGACGSSNPCSFTITAPTSVTAVFNVNQFSVTTATTGNGGGTVAMTPVGTACGTNCMQYSPGTAVTVIAVPNTGSGFGSFSGGGCGSTNPCSIILTAPTTVTAAFSLNSTPTGPGGAGSMVPSTAIAGTALKTSVPVSTASLKSTAPMASVISKPSAGKVASTTTSTPAAPASATYRVTLTGLMCMKAISSDDAIYAAAVVRQYDRRSGQSTMSTNLNTWVYGDVNGMIGQRKQAGSRGPGGGIGDGDFVPNGFIPGIKSTLPPQVNLFPMSLWQGTLSEGIDAVILSPSLWINYGDNPLFSTWNQNEDSFTNSLLLDNNVQNQINSQTLGTLFLGPSANVLGGQAQALAHEAVTAVVDTVLVIPFIELHGPSHDRPIGLTDASSDPTSSTILPNATIVLTRELIEKRLGANNWTMLSIDFKDTAHGFTSLPGSDRPGEYMMFIQIERQ
jgi:hypothetical protein